VFNTVYDAVAATGADASMIYVPAAFAGDAILEAADAGIKVIACITEGIPVTDMLKVKATLLDRLSGVLSDRPELPGRDHSRRLQDGHHARLHPPARQDRYRLALRHADLRSGLPDHEQPASARAPASASAATRSAA
jgi:hypothetical protein